MVQIKISDSPSRSQKNSGSPLKMPTPPAINNDRSLRLQKSFRCRQDFFSQRVIINSWNSLPQYVTQTKNVNSFKNELDNYWKDMGF